MGGIQAGHDLDNVFLFIAETDLKIGLCVAAAEATVLPGQQWLWEFEGVDGSLNAAGVCVTLPVGSTWPCFEWKPLFSWPSHHIL